MQTDSTNMQADITNTQSTQLFICPYKNCLDKKITFVKSEELCEHIDTIHNSKEKYKCGMCDYYTLNLGDMVRHNQKNHMCQWCEYAIAKSYVELNHHVDKYHFCATCNKHYPNKRRHNTEYHDCVIC